MKRIPKWQDFAIGVCLILTVSSVIAATAVYVKKQKETQSAKREAKTYRPEYVKDLPYVISKVKGLDISGVRLEGQGTPEAALVIDVTNNRDAAVMSLDIIAGKRDYSGLSMDGLMEEGNPQVVIPPHTLRSFTWYLGGIMEGEDVYLAAAVFADGKEEGEKRSLEGMRIGREKYQQKKRAENRKSGGE